MDTYVQITYLQYIMCISDIHVHTPGYIHMLYRLRQGCMRTVTRPTTYAHIPALEHRVHSHRYMHVCIQRKRDIDCDLWDVRGCVHMRPAVTCIYAQRIYVVVEVECTTLQTNKYK